MLPWLLCGILAAAAIFLLVKIMLLQKSMDEIRKELKERLSTETNNLIYISSRDRHARELAAGINVQLRLLRRQRRQYLNGDRELKEAVTNIAHDLRTPLTAVCGYLDLLKKEENPEAAARYIGYIDERTQALKRLTEELFQYSVVISTHEDMKTENVALNGALEESIAAFYAVLTERGITPVIKMTPNKVERELNREAISRVFSNILNNALKYSDGDLSILLHDNGEIVFSNRAPGLDEVQVGKLFDRFFSVETASNSTGLGLAISKTLVEQMNGSIAAEYADGRLSIHIFFPE